ncbi:MAG: DUF882 domain-containing protein [Pseudomonadales bacterium]|nr:DUF882 domain-containing protein [Pseudomonadales bacterium]
MKACLCLLLTLGLVPPAFAEKRELAFFHTHTGKSVDLVYYIDGHYVQTALRKLNDFLKDFRNGDEHPIDPSLFDVLHEIKTRTGSQRPFEVISAFRSPVTNEMLRNRAANSGVAKDSMHTHGKAIDVRLADVDLTTLRDVALKLQRGGVGFYRDSNFVHVDTGRVRRW